MTTLIELVSDRENFTCDICRKEVFDGERICRSCDEGLPRFSVRCPMCGRRVMEESMCLECKQIPLNVDVARSVFIHEDEASRLVLRFKTGEKYLLSALSEYLTDFLRSSDIPDFDVITDVPMTEKAEKKRGYNQSVLLASAIAENVRKPYRPLLEKRRETAPQKSLSRVERIENLTNAFAVKRGESVKGLNVLVVDDVMTTGTTGSEIAKTLKKKGAKAVFLLTLTSVPQQIFPPYRMDFL